MILPTHFDELKTVYPEAQIVSEAGIDYVQIPNLVVSTGGQQICLTGLLCPTQHGGYVTRLFLSKPIQGRGSNWTTAFMCGAAWHVWSWNGVLPSLTLLQILSAHLKALR